MNNKIWQDVDQPHRLATPGCVVLITVKHGGIDDIFSVSWNMASRTSPPMVSLVWAKSHYSWELFEKNGSFCMNIPDSSMAKAVYGCGSVSGRQVPDKFSKFSLTRLKSICIDAPSVGEAVGVLECSCVNIVDMGTSALVTAQVLHARADKRHFFKNSWQFENGLELLHHLGGNRFSISKESILVNT